MSISREPTRTAPSGSTIAVGTGPRRVATQGPAAQRWLAARGWRVESTSGPFQVASDELEQGTFLLRRMWFSPSTLLHDGDAHSDSSIEAALVVEGQGQAFIGGQNAPFDKGTVIMRTGSSPLVLEAHKPTAVIQLRTRRARLTAQVFPQVAQADDAASTSLRSVYLAAVTAALNTEIDTSTHQFPILERALESLFDALISSTDQSPMYPPGSSAGRHLYRRAVAIIRARAADPQFTLDTLTSELAVSKPYLQRVFRAVGTTPLQYLHEIRAATATRILAEHGPASRADMHEIAHRAGFTSSRSMRDILARVARRRGNEA